MSNLLFNIATARFSGKVGDFAFDVKAWSGGRGGTKTRGAAHPVIVNNPLLTAMKLKGHRATDHGGPLPLGLYTLVPHEREQDWIRLIPSNLNAMHGRDGFAIHGRGPRGSDGCIVPEDFSVVQRLYALSRENSSIVLEVKAVGDIDYFQKQIDRYSRTA
jgi:hypothetical protein